MHIFLVWPHSRRKLNNAVACTSVVPMQLNCPICHLEINTWQIIAALEDDGGELLLQYWHLGRVGRSSEETASTFESAGSESGQLLKAQEDPQKIFFEGNSKRCGAHQCGTPSNADFFI